MEIRTTYHKKLRLIQDDILAMGSATELGAISRHFGFEPSIFAEHLNYLHGKRPWRRDLIRLVFRGDYR